MSKEVLGIGVIGLGWMGRLHVRAYKALAEHYADLDVNIRLVSMCDPIEANRAFAVESLGFERAVEDYHDLLTDPEVDIVSICLPNYLHREIALATAAAHKPFWIEKPMGVSAEQSRDIAVAAQNAGVVTCVGFNYRHVPAIEKARELVWAGRLGRITNMRCWLLADYAASPQGPLTWRYDRKLAGAGIVGDLMSHGADLVHYVCGRISSVSALTDTFITERPVPTKAGIGHSGWEVSDERGSVGNEDYVAMMIRLGSGAVGTLESSRVSVGPRAEYALEVYGTAGSLRWNFERMNELEVCCGFENEFQGYTRVMAGPDFPSFSLFQPGAGVSMGFDDLKTVEAAQFVRSVATGRQLAPSAADGWAAAEVDEAAVVSAADGCWHDVARVTGQTTHDTV